MRFRDLDDLASALGRDLGVTDWHLVTQQHVDMFADATDAHEWIHIDQERAPRESPFRSTVAHGYLTLSLATPFLTQLLDVATPLIGINYGLNRVPLPSRGARRQRVRARGRLLHAHAAGSDLQTTVELTYEVEGETKPPCTAEVISRLRPDTCATQVRMAHNSPEALVARAARQHTVGVDVADAPAPNARAERHQMSPPRAPDRHVGRD